MQSEYADRLDLLAYRLYGDWTDAQLSALYRANPGLPLAMRAGLDIAIPPHTAPLNYGTTFQSFASYARLAQVIDTAIPAVPIVPHVDPMRGFGPGFGPGFG